MDKAIEILSESLPDVFNHNLETIPSLYKKARPGADYHHSLALLKAFKLINPEIKTKSGLMLGLGESKDEVIRVLEDMREHKVDMLTLGQYLQPSKHHLAVERYLDIEEFDNFRLIAEEMGFQQVASGPMVRSSYHADLQAAGEIIK
jgi:lipoic acid synthetase